MTAPAIGRPRPGRRARGSSAAQLAADRAGALRRRPQRRRHRRVSTAALPRSRPNPPAAPDRRRSRSCIPISATPAWSAAISSGDRQLQGRAAAGARSDVVLVQSRQHARQDRQAPGSHRLLSSGAEDSIRAIGRSRTNLVQALIATKQYIIAKALLLELLGERPQDGALRHQLGKVHYELEEVRNRDRVFRAGDRAQSARCRQPVLDRRHQAAAGRNRGRPSRLCAGRADPASDPAAGDQVAGGFSRAGAVCPVRRQHADRISVQECRPTTPTPSRCSSTTPTTPKPSNRASGRRQPDLGCRPGRRDAAAGRRSGRTAGQADHQRSPQDPAHHTRRGRGIADGHTGLPHPENRRARQAGTELSVDKPAGRVAVSVLHPGPAGRDPWRRRFRKDRRRRPNSRPIWRKPADTDRYFIEYADYRSGRWLFPEIPLHFRR